jgi:hypothetical protein
MMTWHPTRPTELEECLKINPKGMGHELVGRARAVAVWQWLLKTRSTQAFAIESDEPIQGRQIVGFGASVFVSAAFAERELADPKPGLNARLISGIASGQAIVLSEKQLGYENAQGRLHSIVLQGGSMLEGLTPEQCQDVLRQVSLGVIGCLDGYQVRHALARRLRRRTAADDAGNPRGYFSARETRVGLRIVRSHCHLWPRNRPHAGWLDHG